RVGWQPAAQSRQLLVATDAVLRLGDPRPARRTRDRRIGDRTAGTAPGPRRRLAPRHRLAGFHDRGWALPAVVADFARLVHFRSRVAAGVTRGTRPDAALDVAHFAGGVVVRSPRLGRERSGQGLQRTGTATRQASERRRTPVAGAALPVASDPRSGAGVRGTSRRAGVCSDSWPTGATRDPRATASRGGRGGL